MSCLDENFELHEVYLVHTFPLQDDPMDILLNYLLQGIPCGLSNILALEVHFMSEFQLSILMDHEALFFDEIFLQQELSMVKMFIEDMYENFLRQDLSYG